MGIFSDSRVEDIAAIEHIVGTSVAYFNDESSKRGEAVGIVVQSRPDYDSISDIGGRIRNEFLSSTALHRVGTLLVLANSFPLFSILKDGKPMLDLEARKKFLSRFTCFLIQASLSTMTLQDGNRTYVLRWEKFPDAYFEEEFMQYLYLIPHAKVVLGEIQQKQETKDDTKILAHLSLGCSMALRSCVREAALELPPPRS